MATAGLMATEMNDPVQTTAHLDSLLWRPSTPRNHLGGKPSKRFGWLRQHGAILCGTISRLTPRNYSSALTEWKPPKDGQAIEPTPRRRGTQEGSAVEAPH